MKLNALIAGVFGTVGFAVSVLAGMMADNAFDSILWKALLSCMICGTVGYIVGSIGQIVTKEHAVALAKKVAEYDQKIEAEKEEAARKAAAEAAANNEVLLENAQAAAPGASPLAGN
jgi:hypothetical protein